MSTAAAQIDTHRTLHPGDADECVRLTPGVGWNVVSAQAIANLGFYAVIPFLSAHLTSSLAMSTTIVGIVLGVRTASQQGLFLIGGTLADRWGPRALATVGCAVRIAGFILLGLSTSLPGILAGAILTGLGGALFSPSLEATLSHLSTAGRERRTWFARFAAIGEVGALAGPMLGAVAFDLSFRDACLISAGLFVLLGILLNRSLPGHLHSSRPTLNLAAPLADRRFLAFSALTGVQLFAYNQLYFALPLEINAALDNPAALTAAMFFVSSLLVALTQVPLTRLLSHAPVGTLIPGGLLLMALALASVPATRAAGAGVHASIILAALLLVAGHMIVHPTALSVVADFARERPACAYHGLLATCGGIAVLLGNAAAGPLLAPSNGAIPASGWLALAGIIAAAALLFVALGPTARTTHAPESKGSSS